MAHSPLRHHVSSVHSSWGQAIRSDEMAVLRQLPRLTELRVCVDPELLREAEAAGQLHLFLPQALRHLHCYGDCQEVAHPLLLVATGAITSLRSLRIDCELPTSGADWQPLQQLTHLRHFEVRLGPKSADASDTLRAMPQLRSLRLLGRWSAEQLHTLFSPSPNQLQMQLETLSLPYAVIGIAHARELLQAPALTSLHASTFSSGALQLLAQHPLLTRLEMSLPAVLMNGNWMEDLAVFSALSEWKLLRALTVTSRLGSPLPQLLTLLVAAVPLLTELTLEHARYVPTDSIAPLAAARHLHQLTLRYCDGADIDVQLSSLKACSTLQRLIITNYSLRTEEQCRELREQMKRALPNVDMSVSMT